MKKPWTAVSNQAKLHQRWRPVATTSLVLVVLVLVLEASQAMGPLSDQVRLVAQPWQTTISQNLLWMQQRMEFVTRVWQTAERTTYIESEYTRAQAQLSELAQLRDENERLKRQLGQISSPPPARWITTPVVAYPYRLVGVGQQHGVHEGDLVFANQVLVGTLESVGTNSSRVRLLSDSTSQPLVVRTDSGVTGLVTSQQGQLVLTEIPHSQSVRVGERVVTTGQENIDPGLFVGLVGASKTEATDSVQSFAIDAGVAFDTAAVVFIR